METKRIGSTIAMIITSAVIIYFFCIIFSSYATINNLPPNSNYIDGERIDVFGLTISALILALTIVIISAVSFKFSLRNSRIVYKPVRGVNIFLAFCFAISMLLGIIAIILLWI